MKEIPDRYYPMPEIMKYLGISRDTALRWIATKNSPRIKSERSGSLRFQKLTNGSTAVRRRSKNGRENF